MTSLGDLLWQSDSEPNTPETMVDGSVGQRLRIVPSAITRMGDSVATIGDALSNIADGETSETKIRTPEADTVSNNQPKQTEPKFTPENIDVIDHPVHFELEEMAKVAREDVDRIFEAA